MQKTFIKGGAKYIAIFIIAILAVVYFNSKNNTNMTTNSIAVFTTNLGEIKIELFMEESPITAGNFKKLAEDNFYNGIRFHRVIENFMIQSGDPLSKDMAEKARWGTGGPGYAIEDEFIKGLSNVRGTIAMANSGPGTGGSQFFINLIDNVNLDWNNQPEQSKHPVFGKVISGMDIVDKIGSVATTGPGNTPVEDVLVEKITIK